MLPQDSVTTNGKQLWQRGIRLLHREFEKKCRAHEVTPHSFLTSLEIPQDYRVLDLRNAPVSADDIRPLFEALRLDSVFTAIDLRGKEEVTAALVSALQA